ncbi:GGDEF domain-containing protein [Carnobacterium sp. TMP28]|uniref:GGDEF domain-containing protein n=1 Tax=Carnobacterium sp. TMP28 TaxID=3397060 RepID=UPI0039E1B85F
MILLAIFMNIKSHHNKMKFDKKLYLILIISTATIMIVDIIMSYANGKTDFFFREINSTATIIYFILNPLPYIAWSLYVDFYIYKDIKRSKKIRLLVVIPAIISIYLCILSIYNKKIFYIDQDNLYQRGELFWLNAALYYSYSVGTYAQIISKRKNIRKKDYYSLLTFAVVPVMAGILQTIDTSKSYLWLGISISALIIFLNIQNGEISEDYLTGVYNRRQLDLYLKNSIRELKKDELLGMIMIDLNDFKEINDTYGHIEGDQALKYTANILIDSFRTGDFISRYAGDEFVVVMKLESKKDKDECINHLRENLKEFNQTRTTPYKISFGLGYATYRPDLKMTADEFIIHTDKRMYRDKQRYRDKIEVKEKFL